ncbi:hypothetical protein TNCV_2556631 [Trichonephila clavipes]|nr:hypothetical protein TNCV_2556631 [Trichonephila clavipes]
MQKVSISWRGGVEIGCGMHRNHCFEGNFEHTGAGEIWKGFLKCILSVKGCPQNFIFTAFRDRGLESVFVQAYGVGVGYGRILGRRFE